MADEITNVANDNAPLTGHAFDGIQEYDNPLPGWWKWLFIATIVFSLLYWPYYHFGAPGRSVSEQFSVAIAENMRLQFAEIGDLQPNEATLVKMMYDDGWVKFGESVFRANCASCHGLDGGGIVGPNLADEHFKNIREITDILNIVQNGAAAGAMPAWKSRLQLNEQILVSSYVASLRPSLGLRGTTPAKPKGAEGNLIPPWPPKPADDAPAEEGTPATDEALPAANAESAQ